MNCSTCDKYAEEIGEAYEYDCNTIKAGRKVCPLISLFPENQMVVELFNALQSEFVGSSGLGNVVLNLHKDDINVLGGTSRVFKLMVYLDDQIVKHRKKPAEGKHGKSKT